MRQIVPGRAVGAIILAYRSPGALTQIWPPALPVRARRRQPLPLNAHGLPFLTDPQNVIIALYTMDAFSGCRMLQANKETNHKMDLPRPLCFSAPPCYTETGNLIYSFSCRHVRKEQHRWSSNRSSSWSRDPRFCLPCWPGWRWASGHTPSTPPLRSPHPPRITSWPMLTHTHQGTRVEGWA